MRQRPRPSAFFCEAMRAVDSFLAWVAVYEWRLAHLIQVHELETRRQDYHTYGAIS